MVNKIKKWKVYPKEPLEWCSGIYLGMSMNNTVFKSKDMLNQILCEISLHSSKLNILVGDYLDRYNSLIFEEFDEEDAINSSVKKGSELKNLLTDVLIEFDIPLECVFVHSGSFISHPEYNEKNSTFKNYYNVDAAFQYLVDHTVNIFLRRQNHFLISRPRAEKLCREYLFEELTIFEILADQGLKVNIYPGNQLPIIKAMVGGKLKGISESLESIQAVELKFRPS